MLVVGRQAEVDPLLVVHPRGVIFGKALAAAEGVIESAGEGVVGGGFVEIAVAPFAGLFAVVKHHPDAQVIDRVKRQLHPSTKPRVKSSCTNERSTVC